MVYAEIREPNPQKHDVFSTMQKNVLLIERYTLHFGIGRIWGTSNLRHLPSKNACFKKLAGFEPPPVLEIPQP